MIKAFSKIRMIIFLPMTMFLISSFMRSLKTWERAIGRGKGRCLELVVLLLLPVGSDMHLSWK
jgi:hypothetical protein